MYHVTFFGEKLERAWCKLKEIKPFNNDPHKPIELKFKRRTKQLEKARIMALESMAMQIPCRLKRFSFASRQESDGNSFKKKH